MPKRNGDFNMTGVEIDTYEVLRNTVWGNGRMRVHMRDSDGDAFSAITMSDSGVVTDISNYLGDRERDKSARFTVTFSRGGNIRYITRER
jgi:hypothetical protein